MNPFITTAFASEVKDAVNSVGTLSSMISEYGSFVVLLAVFLLIFIFLTIVVLRSNSKMSEQIMNRNNQNGNLESDVIRQFVTAALGELTKDGGDIATTVSKQIKPIKNAVDKLVSEKSSDDNDYHKDLVGAYIDVNMALKNASRTALNDLKCDRIGIYIFHNGSQSAFGLPFFKMSCIHEWTSIGSKTIRGKSHTDMPLHAFDFIETLYKYGCFKIDDVNNTDIKDERLIKDIKEFISFSLTQSLYMQAVKNEETGAITGFVVAEFDKTDSFEHNEIRNDEVQTILAEMIRKISPIIGNKYVFKGSN